MRKIHLSSLTLKKPLIINFKDTSLFTMTNLYTIDHSKRTGCLRNYDPIKQNFCLLPHNNTSRPLIVPKEYLICFDDFLRPCNNPIQIVKSLTVIKHLVSSPLVYEETSYYTALSKQPHSFYELLFIAAKAISFMVQTEQKRTCSDPDSPTKSLIKHSQTTSEKNFYHVDQWYS